MADAALALVARHRARLDRALVLAGLGSVFELALWNDPLSWGLGIGLGAAPAGARATTMPGATR